MRLVDHVVGSCQSLLGDDLWIVLLNDKLAGFNIRRYTYMYVRKIHTQTICMCHNNYPIRGEQDCA